MTPTRDRLAGVTDLDTGTASPVAPRPNVWVYEGPAPASDLGVGSAPVARPDLQGSGDAFIPPLWPR